MESIKKFVQKHKLLFGLWVVFDFVIIFFPQWLDSIWSLAEKIKGRPLAMPHLPIWSYGITAPVGLAMLGIAIWAVRSAKNVEVKTGTLTLTDTLTEMQRRLVELQKQKAKHTKIGFRELGKVLPTLADKIGIVEFNDWPKFEKNLKRRMKAAMPRPYAHLSFVKRKEREQLAVLWVTSAVKKELFQSRQWTFEDGMKISDWLNGFHWGVKEYRDDDAQWKALFESISHYLTDTKLKELIDKHIDLSRFYNDVCLIACYSERFPKTAFFPILYAELVGSPISPEKAEIYLSEILGEIEVYLNSQKQLEK